MHSAIATMWRRLFLFICIMVHSWRRKLAIVFKSWAVVEHLRNTDCPSVRRLHNVTVTGTGEGIDRCGRVCFAADHLIRQSIRLCHTKFRFPIECNFVRRMSGSPQYASLKDKVVLITGASSGIGAGTAKVFAKNGARLALCGRQENNLKKAADECIALGLPPGHVKCVLGDLAELDCCKKIVDEVIEHFGQLDVLVNNAGRLLNNTIETITPEQYDDIMSVNTRSVVFLTQYAVPHLIKTKGTIVNVSSVVGLRSFPGVLAYCMSKAALDHFTRCIALELAPKGIRVNAVNPGVIKTEVHRRGGMSDADYTKFLERGKETHALGRVGEVEEVGSAIAFLASGESSFITGETMPVDGGRHAMCPR